MRSEYDFSKGVRGKYAARFAEGTRVVRSTSTRTMRIRFVVCLDNAGYDASLDVRKLYRVIADDKSEKLGLLRIVDESGEDYLYPKKLFAAIDVSPSLRRRLSR
jgi:hypothetical protein